MGGNEEKNIADVLSVLGCRISITNNISEAVAVIESAGIDCLVADSAGFNSMVAVAAQKNNTPVVVVADSFPPDMGISQFNPMLTDIITRPVKLQEMSFRIMMLLERKKDVPIAGLTSIPLQIVDYSSCMQAIVDAETGVVVSSSTMFKRELGLDKELINNEDWLQLFDISADEGIKDIISGRTDTASVRVVSFAGTDGKKKVGNLTILPFRRNDKINLFLSLFVDCIEDELRAKVDSLRTRLFNLAKFIDLPFVIISEEREKILFVNLKFSSMFGYRHEDIPTLDDWFRAAYPKDVWYQKAVQSWEKQKSTVFSPQGSMISVREFDMFSKDGTRKRVKSFIAKYDSNYYWILLDITGDIEIRQEVRRFSEAVRQNPVGISFSNQLGYLTYVNPMFTAMTGYQAGEAIGRHSASLLKTRMDAGLYDEVWETIRRGEVWKGEYINQKKSGELYWEKTMVSPIFNSRGSITHFMGIHEDITSRKEMVEKLVVSEQALKEANATKDKFFSIIAHDLRNPIGTIINLAALVLRDSVLDDTGKSYVGFIHNTAVNASALLEDLLNWSRSQSGRLVINSVLFDVREEVLYAMGAISEMAAGKNIFIAVDDHAGLTVFGDKNLFHTVIRNLLSNAVKFTPVGGRVEVSFRKEDGFVTISVADNGIGIEQSRLGDLFCAGKNYSTSGTVNEYGTGLGLPLAHEFVTRMGGKIWIESSQGEGTTVAFTLPVSDTGL
jgi:PAS domain S-box-containing protein